MALNKKVELENGIVLNYHRIASINKVTNNTTVIEVASYISKVQREVEQELFQKSQKLGEALTTNVLIETSYLIKEYKEDEDIKELYNYLKTTDKFKNAKDV